MTDGVHRHEHVVREDEIDGLGHANNVVYVRWMIDAATEHSAAVGWDFAAYVRIGGVWVVRRHEIEYLLPAKVGDRVSVFTWVADAKAVQTRRGYEMRLPDGRRCARGTTNWVFLEWPSGRPRRIPEEVRAAFTPIGDAPDLG